jgi:hypothetical protein
MSHKKKHGKSTGITTRPKPAVNGSAGNGEGPVTAIATPETVARSAAPAGPSKQRQRFWLEAVAVRVSHWLGSLQVAVILLALFAMVLAVGTIVESWYSDKVAKDLVYRTWWFNLLLFLIGINIFFAAAKKARRRGAEEVGRDLEGTGYLASLGYWWPWLVVVALFVGFFLPDSMVWWGKAPIMLAAAAALSLVLWGVQRSRPVERWWPWQKHQTGFLITHVGLLTMVAGGLLTGLFGTDTLLALIASPDPGVQQRAGMPQSSSSVVDRDTSAIRVRLLKGGKEDVRSFPFQPGSLPWHADEYLQPNLHPLLAVLDILDHPLPRTWRTDDLGGDAWLEILNYYPHAHKEAFKPADRDDRDPFPAVKFSLTSSLPMTNMNPVHWVAATTKGWLYELANLAVVQMLGPCPEGLLDEFRKAPPAEAGEKGQLVLLFPGMSKPLRLNVAAALDQPAKELGDSGWKVRLTRYLPDLGRHGVGGAAGSPVSNPLVEYELISPEGKESRFGVLARLPGKPLSLEMAGGRGGPGDLERLQVWYHGPDPRFGTLTLKSVLQFAAGPDDKLYYRSFSGGPANFAFDKAGEATRDASGHPIWKQAAGWNVKVLEYLPQAAPGPWIVPEDQRTGLEDPEQKITPAIRCRLHVSKEAKEFMVAKTEDGSTRVSVGGHEFGVGFNEQRSGLGFEVKLLRAETLTDPGTTQRAGYTSWVKLTDKAQHIEGEDRMITMNQPLEHRGLKFFQSGLESAGFDDGTLKPISYSVFTVSSDPGLGLKYLGSTMLALGIACMFYMRAYFFKPRGRRAAAALAGGEGV